MSLTSVAALIHGVATNFVTFCRSCGRDQYGHIDTDDGTLRHEQIQPVSTVISRSTHKSLSAVNFTDNNNIWQILDPHHTEPARLTHATITHCIKKLLQMPSLINNHILCKFSRLLLYYQLIICRKFSKTVEVQHCWTLATMRVAWVAGSLTSGALHYEVGCRWDSCCWIQPTLDSTILQLSSIKPRLMCTGCLCWHPIKY